MSFASEFIEMINRFHSIPREIYDDELEIEIRQNEIDLIKNPPIKFPPFGKAYFSPSSSNSMQRELVVKILKQKRDPIVKKPFTKRWQDAGTAYGDYIQRTLMFIEKHYPKLFGEESPFYFERTPAGYPSYETAIKKCAEYQYKGHIVRIFGQGDGIIIHRATGTRIILEVKSKQTTYASTGHYKLNAPAEDHSRQVTAYSLQHTEEDRPLDHAIIFYGNYSKKGWVMSDEDIEKYPDIRAFDVEITDEKRYELLDYFVEVLEHVKNGTFPPVDLSRWTFCNFKEAIAAGLTDEEYKELKEQVKAVMKSNLPDFKKEPYLEALLFIQEVRKNATS